MVYNMKKTIILIMILLICSSCEPQGGDSDEVYLGRVSCIHYVYSGFTEPFTEVWVGEHYFKIVNKLDIPGASNAFVWINFCQTELHFRGINGIEATYKIIK